MRRGLVVLLCCSLLLAPVAVFAEDLSKEQGDAILRELKEIKQLLQQMARQEQRKPVKTRPAKAVVKTEGSYVLGREDAPLTLVEFTDFQCPFCKRFHKQVFPDLKAKYIDSGKLRYVSRDLPLSFHQYANGAALAGRCAGEQGRFWEFRDTLFMNTRLTQADIDGYARELGLDMDKYQSCVSSKKFQAAIQQDVSDAHAAGFTGTPSFVLGKTGDGDSVDGIAIIGAKPLPYIEAKMAELMSGKQ